MQFFDFHNSCSSDNVWNRFDETRQHIFCEKKNKQTRKDMGSITGGGWCLDLRYVHLTNGTNPELQLLSWLLDFISKKTNKLGLVVNSDILKNCEFLVKILKPPSIETNDEIDCHQIQINLVNKIRILSVAIDFILNNFMLKTLHLSYIQVSN